MEDKYRTLAAQIDNIYRENETVNMNMVAKLIQDTVSQEPYSKYMRAADEAWSWFVNQRSEKFPLEGLAEAIKAEIERQEPLVPGVRYRNTEANRQRIPMYNSVSTVDVVYEFENNPYIGYYIACESEGRGWHKFCRVVEAPADEPTWFSLIPDGKVQDE
jgi:hypothetical protein